VVSIHAARAGGDSNGVRYRLSSWLFQSTPPARAATMHAAPQASSAAGQQDEGVSIHAARAGGDAAGPIFSGVTILFQSTPPARAATRTKTGSGGRGGVSIHAARAGGDRPRAGHGERAMKFQSTPPARAAT